jgi:hypothetical protein
MKTKHTPGPWTVEKFTREHEWVRMRARVTDGEDTVAQLFDSAFEDRNHANARLIAAAPEMLEALELTLEALFQNPELNFCKGPMAIETFEAINSIKAAIRKAKGEL